MKFSFSPLILLAAFFTSTIAAPTENALSKRVLDINVGFTFDTIVIRDVEATVDEHRLGKRALTLDFTLGSFYGIISIKRSEEYKVVITSLPPVNSLSGRSTDAYAGRHVAVNMPDDLVTALEQNGVTQDQLPQYISQNVHATDPETGNKYQLVPASGPNPTSVDDILIDLIYQPTTSA